MRTNKELSPLKTEIESIFSSDILKSIITQIKTGKVSSEDVEYLDKGISKIATMESYEDYGSPLCVMDWRKFMDLEK